MTDESIARQVALRQKSERAATIIRALTLILVVVLVVATVATLFYIVSLQRQIADCSQPGGACYKQGQERTKEAVDDIIGGIRALEEQRTITSNQLKQAVAQLCRAQGVSCPTVP